MTVALCLGGASSVREDWTAALDLFQPDFIVACNDVGTIWPGRLDAWVSLHPEKLNGWREQRKANGYPDADRYLVHGDYPPEGTELVEFRFPGQGDSGSSGLFTAKAALIDLGAGHAVLAGIPLANTAHFFDQEAWEAANDYRAVWEALRPEHRSRIRSMSGWTARIFGNPTTEWLASGSKQPTASPMEITMTKARKIILDKVAYETHPVPYERKRELNAQGFKVLDIRFKPADEPDLREGGIDLLSDEQLRAAIKEGTGKAPHHKLGRDKLIEQFNGLKIEQPEETAANGLTRREITADLEAMLVEFDPADGIEDLAALRDLAREERGA